MLEPEPEIESPDEEEIIVVEVPSFPVSYDGSTSIDLKSPNLTLDVNDLDTVTISWDNSVKTILWNVPELADKEPFSYPVDEYYVEFSTSSGAWV